MHLISRPMSESRGLTYTLRLTAPHDCIPLGIMWSRQMYSGFATRPVGDRCCVPW